MKTVFRAIDKACVYSGAVMHWINVALVAILTYEVIARYIFNRPTMWAHQLSMIFLGAMASFSWAWVHERKEHVRVDIFYRNYSPRAKALTDVIGFLLLFLPLFFALSLEAWNAMAYSFRQHEVMTETYWFPPVGPSRLLIFLGIALILAEGVVQFGRDLYLLIRSKPYD
jgi:TRAP-type mannitol/chloroaromatic compound transport system permease small subunit